MALVTFQTEAAELYRIVQGTIQTASDLSTRIAYIKQALHTTPAAPHELMEKALAMEKELREILIAFNGDRTISRRNENPPTSLSRRLRTVSRTHSRSTSDITQTERDAYKIIEEEFTPLYNRLKKMIELDIKQLESDMEEAGVPWTPGRLPKWEEK